MSFQSLTPIEDSQFFLDLAFSRAKKAAGRQRGSIKRVDKIEKSRRIEIIRILAVSDVLYERLSAVVQQFPSLDQLTPFYQELVKITLNYVDLKKSLGSVDWAAKTCRKFGKDYQSKVSKAQTIRQMNNVRRAFYGRISSLMKEIDKNLKTLESARREMRNFPVVKKMPTVCITGFPNVGKTTLLSKLTGSKPDIQAYAFTTKSLNLGYSFLGKKKVQFIDTPGTLARQNKMNIIERQAYLAMRSAADVLVYVWDVTEPYPMSDQKKLFKQIQKFEKPTIQFVSKEDIADPEKLKELTDKNITSNVKELRKLILGNLD